MTRRQKRIVKLCSACAGVFALAVLGTDGFVGLASAKHVYARAEQCPPAPVAVVLGLAKKVKGRLNRFYMPRLEAAVELFSLGKVRGLIVSGDNSRRDYNEPGQMKADLVELGVPARYVTCDYAGFRTLDSVVRAAQVFGQTRFVVVSQRFHCQRAIFLARQKGYDVWGYAAADVSGYHGLKVRARECLARCKAAMDLWLLRTKPKFLGEPVPVVLREELTSRRASPPVE
ncbi:YdcF family protein [PVC group bacterium]|nr:YdcF family protein [PVC group bacterium]